MIWILFLCKLWALWIICTWIRNSVTRAQAERNYIINLLEEQERTHD